MVYVQGNNWALALAVWKPCASPDAKLRARAAWLTGAKESRAVLGRYSNVPAPGLANPGAVPAVAVCHTELVGIEFCQPFITVSPVSHNQGK